MKMREAQRKIEICSVRLKFATDYRRQYTQYTHRRDIKCEKN